MSRLGRRLRNLPDRMRRIVGYVPYQTPELSYEDYWDRREPSFLAARHRTFIRWIPDRSSVLDVACGDGGFARYLSEVKGCTAVGVDISAAAVSKARERGVEAHVLDVTRETPPGRYDFVVLSAFIEHVVNPEEVIERCLTIAGEVLVSIPNVAFIEHRLRLLLGHFPCQWAFHPAEHVRFWSVRDFHGEMAQLRIEVLDRHACDGVPGLKDVWTNCFGNEICFRLARRGRGSRDRESV